jgi:hypothetical protein
MEKSLKTKLLKTFKKEFDEAIAIRKYLEVKINALAEIIASIEKDDTE